MEHRGMSESEEIIMKLIWAENREISYAELEQKLQNLEYTWKQNTILTFLLRLVEKGLLRVKKVGRKNMYQIAMSELEYQSNQTRTFIGKVYEGNVKGLVNTLMQQELLTTDEFNELQAYWNKRIEEDE